MISDTFFSCHLPGKLLFLIGLGKTGGGGRSKKPLWNRDILKNKWQFFVLSLTKPGRREGGEVSVSQAGAEGSLLSLHECFECFPCQYWPKARCCICRCRGGMYKTNLLGLRCIAQGVTSHECHGPCVVLIDSLAESFTRRALPAAVPGQPNWEVKQDRYGSSSCQQPFPLYPGFLSSSELLVCVRHVGEHL